MSQKTDTIKQAAIVALANARDLAEKLHPGGKVKGSEYITCNTLRGDAKPSLHINLTNGKANDVASPDYHYGDLVAVAADVWAVNQYQAALGILEMYGYSQPGHDSTPDPKQQARLERLRQDAEQKRQAQERQQLAREGYVKHTLAPKLWRQATPEARFCDDPHPYLVKKQIEGHNSRRLKALNGQGSDLLIPICDQGQLVNVQIINPDNPEAPKRFIKGGKVTGCYAPLGRMSPVGTLYICEGWATGATLLEYYGESVACALFAANLEPVARKLRKYWGPDHHIVIAGDDDRGKRTNAGRDAATRAAEAIKADLIFPEFPASAPESLSDFNDLHVFQLTEPPEPVVSGGAHA